MADNTKSVVTASQITTTDQNEFLSIFQNSWFMRILTSWIPGGVIIDVLNFIVNLIDTTEKAVAIQGAGVAKKIYSCKCCYSIHRTKIQSWMG